ncbi:MAG: dihydrolipoyl dehydrogenase [Opitutales bacterium]
MADTDTSFDLIVIGSGPGGYVAAIRAAQLGFKTALVEKSPNLGGTCLNVGCIPSKALLHSTEIVHFLKDKGGNHGIRTGDLKVDIPTLMKKKSAVVDQLRGGVAQLVKKRGITVFAGHGRFKGPGEVEVRGKDETTVLKGEKILIATGSAPVELPFMKFDGKTIVSSDEAIAFDAVPEKLVVVGGGAIGLELGSVWARLGSEVTVVEFLPRIAPTFDEDISRLALRIFKKQGMNFELGTKVTGLKQPDKDGPAILTADKDGKACQFEADRVLVSVGRRPFTDDLGLDRIKLELDDKKRIPVDAHFQTRVKGVYAIGDVTPGPMLAHKAEEEGVACTELMAGQAGHVNYDVIPNVIYTDPEIASVGISEQEANERGIEVKTGKFGLMANGRAIATDATDGIVKVIADAKTDRLLGIQIIAKNASEIIASAVAHMEYGGSAEDLGRTIHAHPTLTESVKEAALSISGSAIHAP